MTKVETRFRSLMLISFIMVLLSVVVGAFLTLYLNFSSKVVAVMVGAVVLLQGMFYFIRYLYDGLGKKMFAVDLIVAVIDIVLGAFTIFYPFAALSHVAIVFGLHLLGNSSEKLYYAIKLKSNNDSAFPILFVISALMILMGVLSIINPFKNFVLASKLIGMFMVCFGIFEGMICKLFFDKAKALLKMF